MAKRRLNFVLDTLCMGFMRTHIRQILKPAYRMALLESGNPRFASQPTRILVFQTIFMVGLLGFFSCAGCSGKTQPDKTGRSQSNALPAPTQEAPVQRPPADTTAKKPNTTRPETPQTISGIPLDVWPEVWFEDPLAVAENKGSTTQHPESTVAVISATTPETQPISPKNQEGDAAEGRPKWATILSGKEIQQETKEVRLTLKQAFQSVQRYNGQYKTISVDGSVLAVLAVAANGHPDSIVWKSHALSVRDLAAEMASAADGLGGDRYDRGLKPYEQVEQLLSGNTPGKLKPPVAEVTFDRIAPRGELMKRLQRSDDRLKAGTTDEDSFREQAERLRHESLMVAMLAAITSRVDYDLADDPDYSAQARSLMEAGLAASKAVEQADFASFSQARQQMTKACAACHLDFRFDEE